MTPARRCAGGRAGDSARRNHPAASATRVSATVPAPVYKVPAWPSAGGNHLAATAARGDRLQIQNRDVPLQQRARCIAQKFQERTANEAEPLSRERIQAVIRKIVADLDDERLRESDG
jgi:hypothetical protein